ILQPLDLRACLAADGPARSASHLVGCVLERSDLRGIAAGPGIFREPALPGAVAPSALACLWRSDRALAGSHRLDTGGVRLRIGLAALPRLSRARRRWRPALRLLRIRAEPVHALPEPRHLRVPPGSLELECPFGQARRRWRSAVH